MNDDFYIGYGTPVPSQSRRLIFAGVISALVLLVALGLVFVSSQRPFAMSSFAFGAPTHFTGVLLATPYPELITEKDRLLLVAPGKHGAESLAAPFDGHTVSLDGALIQRGDRTMLEVVPGSIALSDAVPATSAATIELGQVTLAGEIVDGKCYLGVMNPGEGTVHRDCAVACIRGGLPPLFAAPAGDRGVLVFTLAGPNREPIHAEVADLVGRPVTITGRAIQIGSERLLLTEPTTIRR